MRKKFSASNNTVDVRTLILRSKVYICPAINRQKEDNFNALAWAIDRRIILAGLHLLSVSRTIKLVLNS